MEKSIKNYVIAENTKSLIKMNKLLDKIEEEKKKEFLEDI